MVGRSLILSSLLLFSYLTTATRTNRTIDDEKGDSVSGLLPEFSPPGAWHQGSTCDACLVHLDSSQTFDGTWHDTTYHPSDPEPRSITMQFNGTAIYVYNALANMVTEADTGTNITFTLDGSLVGHYQHIPRNTTLLDYDIPVYTNGTLQNTEHQLVIQAAGPMQSPSLILFDYVVYTFDDTPTPTATPKAAKHTASQSPVAAPTQSSPSTAAIVGGVVGGIVSVLIAVGVFVFVCIRRRRRRQSVHIQIIEEKRRRRKALPRLSILASELGPPSAATYEATAHSAESLLGTPSRDVESQGHNIGPSKRSPLPTPVPLSAQSPRGLHERSGSSWSHTASTALESTRGAYLFGGKSDVDTAGEGSDRPAISLPPASPEDSRPRARRSPNIETAALRSEVAALRKEVEHLREKRKNKTVVNNTSDGDDDGDVDAPPPEYDGPGDNGHL